MRLCLIGSLILQSCASLPTQGERVFTSAGLGAAMGAGSGAVLSPNKESRGMNTLVFGLSGALVGAVVGFFLPSPTQTKNQLQSLEDKEKLDQVSSREYTVSTKDELPEFLKKRVSPAVVEEFIETDQVSEDGTLHAPHKVYRIKHQAELIAAPKDADSEASEVATGVAK